MISSFNHNSLARIGSLDSTIETAILYSYPMYEPWVYANTLAQKLFTLISVPLMK